MIIEIEGIDGVGKTTQCDLLMARLFQNGRRAVVVKDLESTELGRGVRKVLMRNEACSPEVELFSFLACKSQLFSQVIVPTLFNGDIVICDRGIGSFISYFESHGFLRPYLKEVVDLATNRRRPDVTILLDVSIDEAVLRKSKKVNQSRFDMMGDDFFTKQRESFLSLAEELGWNIIDGSQPINDIYTAIYSRVQNALSSSS
jgi:dTMP kinase